MCETYTGNAQGKPRVSSSIDVNLLQELSGTDRLDFKKWIRTWDVVFSSHDSRGQLAPGHKSKPYTGVIGGVCQDSLHIDPVV